MALTRADLNKDWQVYEAITMIDMMGEAFEKGYMRFLRFGWNPTNEWRLNAEGTAMEQHSTWDKPFTVKTLRPATGYMDYVFSRKLNYALSDLIEQLTLANLDAIQERANGYNPHSFPLHFDWLIMAVLPAPHDRRKLLESVTVLGKRKDPPIPLADEFTSYQT